MIFLFLVHFFYYCHPYIFLISFLAIVGHKKTFIVITAILFVHDIPPLLSLQQVSVRSRGQICLDVVELSVARP